MGNKYLNKALEFLEKEGKDAAINYLKNEQENIGKNEIEELNMAMMQFALQLHPGTGKAAGVIAYQEVFGSPKFIKPVSKFDNMSLDELIEVSKKNGVPADDLYREKLKRILENPAITPDDR